MTKEELLQLKPGTIIGTDSLDDDDLIIIDFYEYGIMAEDGFKDNRKVSYDVLNNDTMRSTIFVGEI